MKNAGMTQKQREKVCVVLGEKRRMRFYEERLEEMVSKHNITPQNIWKKPKLR